MLFVDSANFIDQATGCAKILLDEVGLVGLTYLQATCCAQLSIEHLLRWKYQYLLSRQRHMHQVDGLPT